MQTDNYQLPLFTKDRKRVELLLNAATRSDASGEIVGVVGVGQDITEINRTQAELSRVANDLTLLIERANAPIFGIDANGLVNEWNRKAVHITGFSKEEVMGQDLVRKFITAEFQDSVQEVLQKRQHLSSLLPNARQCGRCSYGPVRREPTVSFPFEGAPLIPPPPPPTE